MGCGQRLSSRGQTLNAEQIEELGKLLLEEVSQKDARLSEVKSLIARGANVDAQNKDARFLSERVFFVRGVPSFARQPFANALRRTPLMIASAEGHLDIVKFLVKSGADINAKDVTGHTPLFWADFKGYDKVQEYLESLGAECSVEGFLRTLFVGLVCL